MGSFSQGLFILILANFFVDELKRKYPDLYKKIELQLKKKKEKEIGPMFDDHTYLRSLSVKLRLHEHRHKIGS